MREKIFISYKRVDKERVFKLKDLIELETQEKCWIDLDGIESDDQFGFVIANAIEKADVFLFMYSYAHSQIVDYENDWTIREINYAQQEKKRIVFVNLDQTPLTKWFKLVFGLKQQVDATSREEIMKLLRDLNKWLSEGTQIEDKMISINKKTPVISKVVGDDDDFETAEVLFEAKEYNDAVMYYLASAANGNKRAQEKLCQYFYDNRLSIASIPDEIWQKIQTLVEGNEDYAFFLMHCKYYYDSSARDLSFDLVKKATISKDIPLAFLRLGTHYGWGIGTKQNHILAMHNYMKAYDMGCKEACGFIGSEYEYGSPKTPKDIDKAIEYYKKGLELRDERSMGNLARLYFWELKNIDEAKSVAKKMIEYGIYRGYTLMGDFCIYNPEGYYNNENVGEAKKWYREALLHNEYEAYSSLADIHWFIDENHEAAYSLARQGYNKRDSSSMCSLGTYCLLDDKFDESWSYFKERYDVYGNGTSNLGSLFFDYNYRKKDKEEEALLEKELEEILTSGAQNGDLKSLKYLIRLHSLQEFEKDEYDFENFKKSSKIQEDIKLGADIEYPEMMFYYGRLLLEESYTGYNPARGANLIFNSAIEGQYQDALQYLLDYKKHGIDRDDIDLDKIFTSAISQKFIVENYIDELLQFGENNENVTEEFKEYLTTILNNEEIKIRQTLKALNILLNKQQKGEFEVNGEDINKYKDLIDNERVKGNLGYLSLLRSNLQVLYKEYDAEHIYRNYSISTDTQRQLFYAANYANDKEVDIKEQDEFLERLHSMISYDESLISDAYNHDNDVKELMQAIVNYRSSYIATCKKRGITPLEYGLPKDEYQFPYMPSSVCVKIAFDTFNIFMNLRDSMPEIYEPMFPILRNDEEMLNYMETLGSDQDLQLFFIELIEIKIDIEAIMLKNFSLYKSYKENNKKPVVEYLNQIIEKYEDKVHSDQKTYTEENLPDISKVKPKRNINLNDIYIQSEVTIQSKSIDGNKRTDDAEFEKLLDDFINSSNN